MTGDTDLPTVPRSGNVLDLDALEAQRREGRGDALEVKWQGTAYTLPVELPMEAVEELAAMAEVEDIDEDADPQLAAAALKQVSRGLDGGLAVLFCTELTLPERPDDWPADQDWHVGNPHVHSDDCAWRTFCRTRPSLETRMALVNGVWAAYGISLGEALAPTQQLAAGGRPSARTSRASTSSTRATSGAGAKAPGDRQPRTPRKAAAAKKAPAKKAASSRRRAAE